MKNEYHILSFGAGTQSTLLYLLACTDQLFAEFRERDQWGRTIKKERKQINLDAVIFADTQDEPEAVYDHLQWCIDFGKRHGGPEIMVRTIGKLSDNLKQGLNATGQRFVSIPAFTSDGIAPAAITRRQCTREYKIDVIERTIRREILGFEPRQRWPKDVICHQYIGFSFDEKSRVMSTMGSFERYKGRQVPNFPLFDHEMTRQQVIDRCMDFDIPHVVPRSACTFCPYRGDAEWIEMKQNAPKDFAQAVELDHAIRLPSNVCNRKFDQHLYIHRSCQPLDQVDFKTPSPDRQSVFGFDDQCVGMCGL